MKIPKSPLLSRQKKILIAAICIIALGIAAFFTFQASMTKERGDFYDRSVQDLRQSRDTTEKEGEKFMQSDWYKYEIFSSPLIDEVNSTKSKIRADLFEAAFPALYISGDEYLVYVPWNRDTIEYKRSLYYEEIIRPDSRAFYMGLVSEYFIHACEDIKNHTFDSLKAFEDGKLSKDNGESLTPAEEELKDEFSQIALSDCS